MFSPSAFGGIDSKVTSASLFKKDFGAWGISGPTYYEQPVFTWNSQWSSTPHAGQPQIFNFPWVLFQPDKL